MRTNNDFVTRYAYKCVTGEIIATNGEYVNILTFAYINKGTRYEIWSEEAPTHDPAPPP